MSQSSINASQKEPKESGTCRTCYGSFRLLRRDGSLSKHGSQDNPCPGSYTAPSNEPMHQRPAWTAIGEDHSSNASMHGRPLMPLQTTIDVHTLSHPPWSIKINRIPCAARASCWRLLTDIFERISESPSSKSKWKELLLFAPIILTKPKHGGLKGILTLWLLSAGGPDINFL